MSSVERWGPGLGTADFADPEHSGNADVEDPDPSGNTDGMLGVLALECELC